jgi:hypothetical protein
MDGIKYRVMIFSGFTWFKDRLSCLAVILFVFNDPVDKSD